MIKVEGQHRFESIREFQFIEEHPVGSGSFGIVKLARHRRTTRMYAVKVISLAKIPSETELRLFEREISLHSGVDHPHVIKLWETILEDDCIYMIMEYAENGNLFYHQNTKHTFTEPEAFRFFTQTLQGVAYLHASNLIHRDLKPENLLLDCYNNIKICDLGWAAEDINQKRTTFCGTYEYMAPEMLFKTDYDHRVDIWALGVLLYELLHGHAPFKGKTVVEVQESMLKGGYQMNPKLSESARDLISNILQISVGKRCRIEEIFEHPWVKQMESHINNYMRLDKVELPHEVCQKISKIPAMPPQKAKRDTDQHKNTDHRKNSSMNLMEPSKEAPLHVSLTKPKKANHHSHEKENSNVSVPMHSPKELIASNSHSGLLRKNKMLGAVKTQMNEMEAYKHKKTKKSSKISREGHSFEKDRSMPEVAPFTDSKNKRKKNTRSEVEMLAEKYPIRFNTEASEKDDWEPKLKKSHMNSKILGFSRSAIRLPKGAKVDHRC